MPRESDPPVRSFRNVQYALMYGATTGWMAVFREVLSKAPADWVHNLSVRNVLAYLIMLYEHDEGADACPTLIVETPDGMLIEKRDGDVTIEVLCMPTGIIENTVFVGSQVIEMRETVLGPLQVPPVITEHFGTINALQEALHAVQSREHSPMPAGVSGEDRESCHVQGEAPVSGNPSTTIEERPAVADRAA